MKVKGSLADTLVLVEIDPRAISMFCLVILKALYGMTVSQLLFCRKLRKDFGAAGFQGCPMPHVHGQQKDQWQTIQSLITCG